MRVIFLDIDGVLNTNDEARYHKLHEIEIARGYGTFAESFCPMPEQTKRLLKMANTFPNTQIVISSSWRNSGIPSHMWECLLYAAGGHNLPVRVNFEATNTLKLWEHRGLEIKQWLMDWDKLYREYQIRYNHEHILEDPIESFVILDDDRDMEPFMDRLNAACAFDDASRAPFPSHKPMFIASCFTTFSFNITPPLFYLNY